MKKMVCVCLAGCLAAVWVGCAVAAEMPPVAAKETFTGFTEVKLWSGHRIPAIVLTTNKTLLAFAEHRRASSDHGPVDLVLRRSTDLGKTWSPSSIIHGGFRFACGNPCPVVDRDTGTVWLLFAKGNNAQIMITHSKDDGLTWAEPKALTEPVKDKEGNNSWQATGPNHGIQLSTGRLLAPANAGRSFCCYSDDHGETWKKGKMIDVRSSECVATELVDGTVVLNVRDERQRKENRNRSFAISTDGGVTWGKSQVHPDLLGPEHCNSQVRLSDEKRHDRNRILHSGAMGARPGDKQLPMNRQNLMVYISYDEGKTFQQCKLIHTGQAAYSDLVVLPDMSIGCLYETNDAGWQSIMFARFTLEWLTDGKDKVVPKGK